MLREEEMSLRSLATGARAVRRADLDPPPPPPDRRIRIAARVMLWTLIGLATVRGVLPVPAVTTRPSGRTGPAVVGSPEESGLDRAAMATAAAFLREYLTVDDNRSERPARLARYLARGVPVDDGVLPTPGVLQSPDLVMPAELRRRQNVVEVTLLAHLVRTHAGPTVDGGTVAFAVPMIEGAHGVAVSGMPRPVALPIDPTATARPASLSTGLADSVAGIAGRAVAAMLNGDRAALLHVGGNVAPAVRSFPDGWRPIEIMRMRPSGPPDMPSAEVLVRARPPAAGIDYLVPVRVSLRAGTASPTVREVDAGGGS
jgi:hypothetical protein